MLYRPDTRRQGPHYQRQMFGCPEGVQHRLDNQGDYQPALVEHPELQNIMKKKDSL